MGGYSEERGIGRRGAEKRGGKRRRKNEKEVSGTPPYRSLEGFAIDHAAIVMPSQMAPEPMRASISAGVARTISNSSVSSGVPPIKRSSLATYTRHISSVTPL